MKKFQKAIVCGLTLVTVGGAIAPVSSAFASEVVKKQSVDMQSGTNDLENAKPSVEQLKELGLSDSDIDNYLTTDKTGITLYYGEAYDKDGNLITDGQDRVKRGKLSWAVKAIRKSYSKAPKPVKNLIAKYTQLEVLLGLIDHFTGAVEDAIYWACKQVGMPDWAAWTVSKGLTLLI